MSFYREGPTQQTTDGLSDYMQAVDAFGPTLPNSRFVAALTSQLLEASGLRFDDSEDCISVSLFATHRELTYRGSDDTGTRVIWIADALLPQDDRNTFEVDRLLMAALRVYLKSNGTLDIAYALPRWDYRWRLENNLSSPEGKITHQYGRIKFPRQLDLGEETTEQFRVAFARFLREENITGFLRFVMAQADPAMRINSMGARTAFNPRQEGFADLRSLTNNILRSAIGIDLVNVDPVMLAQYRKRVDRMFNSR